MPAREPALSRSRPHAAPGRLLHWIRRWPHSFSRKNGHQYTWSIGTGEYSSMKQMLALILLGGRMFATTAILQVNATPQQLVIVTTTDQTGFCTYRISEGTAFVTSV